jgi:hypothetical protein
MNIKNESALWPEEVLELLSNRPVSAEWWPVSCAAVQFASFPAYLRPSDWNGLSTQMVKYLMVESVSKSKYLISVIIYIVLLSR